jgi:hypothetical protein
VPVRTDTVIAGSPTRSVLWGVRDGFWDGEERRFGGFLETRMVVSGPTANDTQITVNRQHAGVGTERTLRGKTLSTRTENGLGVTLTSATTSWEACRLESLGNYDLLRKPVARSSISSHHEGVATPLSTVTYVVLDAECRTIEEYDDGRVDLEDDETRTTRRFATNDDVRWIRDRVCEESTYSGDGEVLLERSRHFYGGAGAEDLAIDPCTTVGLGLERPWRAGSRKSRDGCGRRRPNMTRIGIR